MTSKSFCLEDLQLDTKKHPALSDKSPMTPQVYNSFQKKQEKEFLQLYIKARSQSRDSKGKNSPRSQRGDNSPRGQINDENVYKVASEPHSPNVEGNKSRRKTILRNLDTNSDLKTFTSEKPSQFKRNHEAEVIMKNQQPETQACSIKLEHGNNNESFHYLGSRDNLESIQGPTSMEILLPSTKDRQYRESHDLEIKPDPENIIEEEIQENEQEQQIQQGPENESQNQNNENHRAIEIESSPPTITTTTVASIPIVFGSHIEQAYMQIFGFYAIWFLSYAILLGLNFEVLPYHVAFLFAWGVEGYYFYSNCKAMRGPQYDYEAPRRKLNYNFYILSLALIQVLGVMKFEGVSFPITLGVIPLVIVTLFTCYLNSSRNSRKSNSIITFIQTLITLQVISVCLKVDGYLFWSWTGVFWIGWASLAVIGLYGFSLLVMFLFYLFFEESSASKRYQLVGLGSVIIGCCGYVATLFFLLTGFTSKLEDGNDKNYIQFALLGGMAHVAFLSAFTFCARNNFKRFLQYVVVVPPPSQNEQTSTPQVRFEKATEGLPAYIVKFTSSYFLTFDESLKLKDEKKLRNMKKKVTLAKASQYKRSAPEPVKLLSFKALSPLLPKFLAKKLKSGEEKRDSIPLSENRAEMTNIPQLSLLTKNRTLEEKSPTNFKAKPQNFASEAKKNVKGEGELYNSENENEKICFSANDIDFVRKIEAFEFSPEAATPTRVAQEVSNEKDDKSCIICFDKSADAVIMGCGHGGICYECALESWKKSQECFLCRAKIEKVLHIDANKVGKFNMTKVLSATKLAKDREEPEYGHHDNRDNFRSSLYTAMNYL